MASGMIHGRRQNGLRAGSHRRPRTGATGQARLRALRHRRLLPGRASGSSLKLFSVALWRGCPRRFGSRRRGGLDRGFQFAASRFRGGVVLHAVEQIPVQALGSGADGALAATVDQSHQRADMPGAAGEQVVGTASRGVCRPAPGVVRWPAASAATPAARCRCRR